MSSRTGWLGSAACRGVRCWSPGASPETKHQQQGSRQLRSLCPLVVVRLRSKGWIFSKYIEGENLQAVTQIVGENLQAVTQVRMLSLGCASGSGGGDTHHHHHWPGQGAEILRQTPVGGGWWWAGRGPAVASEQGATSSCASTRGRGNICVRVGPTRERSRSGGRTAAAVRLPQSRARSGRVRSKEWNLRFTTVGMAQRPDSAVRQAILMSAPHASHEETRRLEFGGLDVHPTKRLSTLSVSYPQPRRDESVVDDYHGLSVSDPYRWLENPDSEETQQFVEAQNTVTRSFLASCEVRSTFRRRMTELYDYPRQSCPKKCGGRYFFSKNTGLQPQNVLYVQDSFQNEPEVLFDPNLLSEDGTVALSSYRASKDGEYMAFALSSRGSDWQTIHVINIKEKRQEKDELKWVKFTCLSWTHDNKGFFYNRFPEMCNHVRHDAGTETDINLHQKLYYHVLGTDQSEDILCWEDPQNPKWMFHVEVSHDGNFLIMSISEGCMPVNRLYYCDLKGLSDGIRGVADGGKLLPMEKLVDNFDAEYCYTANDGTLFTFFTNSNAPRNKLSRVDLRRPDEWVDVIEESDKDVMEWARCVNDSMLLICYLQDVKHVLQVHDYYTGKLIHRIPLEIGSVTAATGQREDSEIFFSFTSFLTPGMVFRVDLTTGLFEPEVLHESNIQGFDKTMLQTQQVFVPSKDGTKVPMFVISRCGMKLDGMNPVLLYGYGGFNISLTPSFSVARIILARHLGTAVAIANIRGGGEYGKQWHMSGILGKKQNGFDDFQSCAKYLIDRGYTHPSLLSIQGGSNGGLLVAACMNQAPELFKCGIAHVGVLDMLRFHRFTIGHSWTTDYGSADDPEQFQWLIRYSPLHNVRRPWEDLERRANQYPAVMLLTADHDDRVVPLHSLKFAATLQHELVTSAPNSPQANPLLLRIDTKAGHGAGRPTQKIIDEYSDTYAFMVKMTGASWID